METLFRDTINTYSKLVHGYDVWVLAQLAELTY